MASKHTIEKNSTIPNQPHSQEVKYSTTSSKKPFKVPYNFISSQFTRRYLPEIPTQPTLDLSYTSSPNIPHQDSSSNEDLQSVTLEEPLYLITKTKINQLCHHTRSYHKFLGQIFIIYEIPISRVSQRRTQPYSDGETLTSNIDDIIIDTIYDIRQPIIDISHSDISKDPKF